MFEAVDARSSRAAKPEAPGLFRRVLKITGRPESDVDAKAQPIYGRWPTQAVPISTTILAVLGQIELHLTATAPNRAKPRIAALDPAVRAAPGGARAATSTAWTARRSRQWSATLLRERRLTIAVAESCTGGLLTSRLTDVPGSSDYVERGDGLLQQPGQNRLLGVPAALIAEHGAVSEPVARAMAEGIRAKASADIGIGVTGIADRTAALPKSRSAPWRLRCSRVRTRACARFSSWGCGKWSSFSPRRPR